MSIKGVIVAAGYGTRLLPVTRVVPKELLPLVDRPAIDFIAEEFEQAGITEVLLITSRRKRTLEDWFDRDPELEQVFEREQAWDKLAKARPRKLHVEVVRQQDMGGTGDALRLARTFAGADPVVVAYPDDLFTGGNPTARLIDTWRQTGCSVLTAENLEGTDVSRYGVLDAVAEGDWLRVRDIVEKPAPGTEPSHWVTYGRYLYTPDFFPILEQHYQAHEGGEYYPMPAITEMASAGRVVAVSAGAVRRDTGTTLGYLQAVIDEALSRPDLAESLRAWLQARLDLDDPRR